ncbi:MAG: tRNA (adenosine(37)-N6)-dimethylallyltransferase MiaA [Rickettsiales bacterium]|jgi:tRNA dimethylallyltransferase|nr:tRNA (adenosine(37)-N6)-dimethylallyltransferase MiaA [Rickettsiales bacterium]
MNKIVVISGPTASGKTAFAVDYAIKNNGVIINADSRQILKGLPILSAQPSENEKKQVAHVLYDYLEPTDDLSVGIWLDLVKIEIDKCLQNNKTPLVVGGTGMYISKLVNGISKIPETTKEIREESIKLYNKVGYDKFREITEKIDEESVKKINKNDKQRLMRIWEVYEMTKKTMSELQKQPNISLYPSEYFKHINICPPKEITYNNCQIRFEKMLKIGVLDEVCEFHKKYKINSNTIGYGDCLEFINKKITQVDLIERVTRNTRKYAKRQYTWFAYQFKKFDEIITCSAAFKNLN